MIDQSSVICQRQMANGKWIRIMEPGQVLAGALTATPTVVWAPEVPPGPFDSDQTTLSQSQAFATPVKDQVLIYTPESREAIVCKFIAQGNYA